jgi:Family of unknown function (DUF5989)
MRDLMTPESKNRFEEESARARPTLVAELWDFLRTNKRFWMLPIFVVFAFFGLLMLVGGTAAAPFIYSLF